MTLVKYAMYARGEQLHASVWPACCNQREHIQFGTRQYALEGRTFVVVAWGVLEEGAVPQGRHDPRMSVRDGRAPTAAAPSSALTETIWLVRFMNAKKLGMPRSSWRRSPGISAARPPRDTIRDLTSCACCSPEPEEPDD
jgi:hypothetical protein